ncbi:MAG: HNH endonuclease [Planctomycetota bacterium]|nr:HNH endonuclease [Planctomycetota bacterium]
MTDNSLQEQFFKRLEAITPWARGDERAPHKPLLLLMILGRIQRGEERLTLFTDIEKPLLKLLNDFGPSRRSQHPGAPFWRLQVDKLWDIPEAKSITTTSSGDAHVSSLRMHGARGGFSSKFDLLLRSSPEALTKAARTLLDGHFAPSIHEDILNGVGLTLDVATSTSNRVKRDPTFRPRVLVAYEYRCAICGLDGRLNDTIIGLEAAHVRWACHKGPSTLNNGLCLCALHHKAFDKGAIGLSENLKVIVSQHLHGGEQVKALFLAYSGKALKGPQAGQDPVSLDYQRWHFKNIFRREARPPAA